MSAVVFHEFGGPEVLRLEEVPEVHPGPGQVRVAVRASSVNPLDWKVRAGFMAQGKPLDGMGTVGFDAAGVVDEIGEGVTDVAVGDDVFGLGSGTAADQAVLEVWAAKPASVDWAVAAAAGVAGETAIRALDLVGVGPGTSVLVDGGAGGVGAVVVQVALARGARVIATAGADNQDYLREIGATPLRYGDGLAERVREIAPDGVDAVVDIAGKTAPAVLVGLVPAASQVVTIANFGAGEAGVQVTAGRSPRALEALETIGGLLAEGKLVIKVQTFPFARATEAHRISEGGHVRGKLVLIPEG
ncbi:NADP-dependent oxidoreductase [Nakamurella sp.]|uniref:NADP-dependent oxidoreductase n=1 Tax=Nakamurella sp. TaxID=1869182 RepID=UPI003B3A8D84